MYLPYFRGKQFELAAIRELTPVLRSSGQIIPIIEPVKARATKNDPAGLAAIEALALSGIEMILVTNPQKGDLRSSPSAVDDFLTSLLAPNVMAGYIVGPKTEAEDVIGFLSKQKVRRAVLLHWGGFTQADALAKRLRPMGSKIRFQVFYDGRNSTRYVHLFSSSGDPIILSDGFQRQARNDEYPSQSYFSDLYRTHKGRGYSGFGDFLIVGDEYRDSGGRPLAVTLHLTNLENEEIWTHHFVSDDTEGRGENVEGKFLQALAKAVRFIRSPKNHLTSEGCREYLELYRRKHFPTLGPPKKISMKHHVELMSKLLG